MKTNTEIMQELNVALAKHLSDTIAGFVNTGSFDRDRTNIPIEAIPQIRKLQGVVNNWMAMFQGNTICPDYTINPDPRDIRCAIDIAHMTGSIDAIGAAEYLDELEDMHEGLAEIADTYTGPDSASHAAYLLLCLAVWVRTQIPEIPAYDADRADMIDAIEEWFSRLPFEVEDTIYSYEWHDGKECGVVRVDAEEYLNS